MIINWRLTLCEENELEIYCIDIIVVVVVVIAVVVGIIVIVVVVVVIVVVVVVVISSQNDIQKQWSKRNLI